MSSLYILMEMMHQVPKQFNGDNCGLILIINTKLCTQFFFFFS